MLSAGWMTHLGTCSVILSVLTGIGTTLYYQYCRISKRWNLHRPITLFLYFSGMFGWIIFDDILSLWKLSIIVIFSGVLLFYPTHLRKIPYFKPIIISTCWTFFVLILPYWLTAGSHHFPTEELGIFWILFFAFTIPSDIRDAAEDSFSIQTLPQIVGVKPSGNLGMALIFLFGLSYYWISGSVLMLCFSAPSILLLGWFLRKRDDAVVIVLDAMLLLPGIFLFYL